MKRSMLFLFAFSLWLSAEPFKILTEHSPPYNYNEQGYVTGFATDIVRELLRRLNHPDTIELVEWTKGYNTTQNNPGYILYSTSRTPAREKLFKWVGPLFEYEIYFYAKTGNSITIKTLEDAKKVKAIGTYKDDAQEQFLKSKGFTNLVSATQEIHNPPKLMLGIIDLWVADDIGAAYYTSKRAGIPVDKFKQLIQINSGVNYLAFSPHTSDADIQQWQKTLDALKADGTYQRIKNRYLE